MGNIEEDKIIVLVVKRKDKYQTVIFIALDLNTCSYLKYTYSTFIILLTTRQMQLPLQ